MAIRIFIAIAFITVSSKAGDVYIPSFNEKGAKGFYTVEADDLPDRFNNIWKMCRYFQSLDDKPKSSLNVDRAY